MTNERRVVLAQLREAVESASRQDAGFLEAERLSTLLKTWRLFAQMDEQVVEAKRICAEQEQAR
jgi:hypothetical protein